MVSDLWHHLTYNSRGSLHTVYAMLPSNFISLIIRVEHGIQCMPCSPRIISEMLPETHAKEVCDFLNPILLVNKISV